MSIEKSEGISGKIALITGGTTGIGRATAQLLHSAGARVAVTGRNPDTLAAARRELPADIAVLEADARSLSDATRLAGEIEQRFGKLDILSSG
jgi:NAD(P)-dependent dehydrogenase (short-subunit alcohol dehydrogenase family)